MTLKIGDVVKLKSGSPTMTVQGIGNYSSHGLHPGVLCVWFDVKGRNEALFHPDMLKLYSAPDRPEFADAD